MANDIELAILSQRSLIIDTNTTIRGTITPSDCRSHSVGRVIGKSSEIAEKFVLKFKN